MTTFNDIRAAFAPYADFAATWYSNRIRNTFKSLAREDSKIYPVDVPRDAWNPIKRKYSSIRRYLRAENDSYSIIAPQILSEDFLAREAAKFGEEQVASFIAKIEKKIGHLTNVKVKLRQNSEFTISGEHNGDSVAVDQQCVFKVSSKGNPFLQWPARIYVNGKFVSEKTFSEMK